MCVCDTKCYETLAAEDGGRFAEGLRRLRFAARECQQNILQRSNIDIDVDINIDIDIDIDIILKPQTLNPKPCP